MGRKGGKQFCPNGHDTHIKGRGKSGTCKQCTLNASLAWSNKNPEKKNFYAAKARATKFGLTVEQVQEFLNKGCEACGTKEGRLCMDHNHETGQFRGILCHSCNAALGLLKDSPEKICGLLAYIEGYA